jgi:thymidylate synthase (FAD)
MKYLPSVKLLYYIPEAENIVASSAKATLTPRDFNSIIGKMSRGDLDEWILELIVRGHGSPLEHSLYIYEVTCSRVCSHQLVRHRHASYTQLSQRYSDKYLRGLVEYASRLLGRENPKTFNEVASLLLEAVEKISDFSELLELASEAYIIPPRVVENRDIEFLRELLRSTVIYYRALGNGAPYEDARYILPQAVKTRVIVSMNARELVEVFLPLRMCSRAQWEIRAIAWQLWRQLVEVHPAIFKYTGPRCVLMENRTRRSPCTLRKFLEDKCDFTIERCPEKTPRDKIRECLKSSLAII